MAKITCIYCRTSVNNTLQYKVYVCPHCEKIIKEQTNKNKLKRKIYEMLYWLKRQKRAYEVPTNNAQEGMLLDKANDGFESAILLVFFIIVMLIIWGAVYW